MLNDGIANKRCGTIGNGEAFAAHAMVLLVKS